MNLNPQPHELICHTLLNIDNTRQTMKQYRTINPKPELFDLIHKFKLTESQINNLDFYKLKRIQGPTLRDHLNQDKGAIKFGAEIFVPIYQNTSRLQIDNSRLADWFWLSFRSTKDGQNIVLIQPDTNSKNYSHL